MHFLIGADIVTFTSRLIFLKKPVSVLRSDLHEGINAVRNHCLDALLPPHTGCHLLDQKAACQCNVTHILTGYIRYIRNREFHKTDTSSASVSPFDADSIIGEWNGPLTFSGSTRFAPASFNFSEASATAASYPVMTI